MVMEESRCIDLIQQERFAQTAIYTDCQRHRIITAYHLLFSNYPTFTTFRQQDDVAVDYSWHQSWSPTLLSNSRTSLSIWHLSLAAVENLCSNSLAVVLCNTVGHLWKPHLLHRSRFRQYWCASPWPSTEYSGVDFGIVLFIWRFQTSMISRILQLDRLGVWSSCLLQQLDRYSKSRCSRTWKSPLFATHCATNTLRRKAMQWGV